MALSNLRTGITVRQERVTASPNVQSTTLPVVLVGVNRDLKYQAKADIFDWSAGTAASGVEFPGFVSGVIEDGTANPALKPRFFVSNTLGTAEITDNVTLGNLDSSLGAPTFDIPSGLSATFTIASGVAGAFVRNTAPNPTAADEDDTFRDLSADFVFDQVRVGDALLVNGVKEYEVTGVTQDTELTVRREGKGPEVMGAPEAAKLVMGPENSEDLRSVITTSQAFIDAGGFGPNGTRVKGGDMLTVDNHRRVIDSGGIFFGYEGQDTGSTSIDADKRWVSNYGAGTPAVYEPDGKAESEAVGTAFFVTTDTEPGPAFYCTTADNGSFSIVKDFASGNLTPAEDSDLGRGYVQFDYIVEAVNAIGTGSFGQLNADGIPGVRAFVFENPPAIDEAVTPLATASDYHILIKDVDGVWRPVFRSRRSYLASNMYYVFDLPGCGLEPTDIANNVEYMIVTAVRGSEGGMATATAADANGVRTITSPGQVGATASEGDLVFNDQGVLMFELDADITSTTATDFTVRPTKAAGAADVDGTISQFGFSVRAAGEPSTFVVRRVVSDSELEVKQATTTVNQVDQLDRINGFLYTQVTANSATDPKFASVTVGDSAAGIAYSVDKTVSGANLTGDVLVSYAAVRDDLIGLQEITSDDYASVLGDDTVDNPLGLAARVYFGNSSANLFVVQVAADTTEGWLAAIEATKTDAVYNIVPLTQEETYLGLFQASTIEQSTADNKRERVLWQSKAFPQNVVLASWEFSDNATVSRTAEGAQTVYINRDLLALSVAVGDDFSGTWFNVGQAVNFAGRILDIEVIGSTTTLTILPDGNVPVSTTNMVVSAYEIKDRPKSLAERRAEVAAYPATIADRRIRNIFPDRVRMQFSDNSGNGQSTGFYGGGVQIADAGGYYMCVVEAAKRTVFGAAKPLTKRAGSGIYQVLDSFAEAPGFQDTIIDAGNYYMEQPGGVGAAVQTIRALTTDVSELITAEESVTPQIDSFTRRLRAQLTPLLGPEILDQRFFDLVSTVAQSAVTRTLNEKQLKSIKLLEITESPDTADTFLMKYEVAPYFSGARGIITLFF